MPSPESHEYVVSRMTAEEIREFVHAFCDGRVFAAAHLPPLERIMLLPRIFLPLGSDAFQQSVPEDTLESVGMVWEWVDRAHGRVEGRPVFASMRLMHVDDWAIAVQAIRDESERRSR